MPISGVSIGPLSQKHRLQLIPCLHRKTRPGDSAGQGVRRSVTPDVRDPRTVSGFSEPAARPWFV